MRRMIPAGLAIAALGAAGLMSTPVSAQVARPQIAAQATDGQSLATEVQWRRRGYGYWGHGYRHRHWGGGAALGAGLATGMIVGGALAAQSRAQAYEDSSVEYCMSRFRSYDPASGTYLGYDGRRHPCP
jgi:hypothetical protein